MTELLFADELASPEHQVAAVIPAYNSSATICNAIESVLGQSFPCREVIVVDDGSSDNIVEIVSRRFPSVKLVSQDNLGAAAARNAGVAGTSAPLIAFLDADDVWHPQKVELQVRALVTYPTAVACCTNSLLIGESHDLTWPVVQDNEVRLLDLVDVFAQPYLATPTVMVRRPTFEALDGFNVELPTAEDIDLWLRLAKSGAICRLESTLVGIRSLNSSLSKRDGYGDLRNLQVVDSFLSHNPDFSRKHTRLVRRTRSKVLCRIGSGHLTNGEFSEARRVLTQALDQHLFNIRAWYLFAKSVGFAVLH